MHAPTSTSTQTTLSRPSPKRHHSPNDLRLGHTSSIPQQRYCQLPAYPPNFPSRRIPSPDLQASAGRSGPPDAAAGGGRGSTDPAEHTGQCCGHGQDQLALAGRSDAGGGEKGMRATVTVAALLEEAEVRAQADLQVGSLCCSSSQLAAMTQLNKPPRPCHSHDTLLVHLHLSSHKVTPHPPDGSHTVCTTDGCRSCGCALVIVC